MTNLIFLLFLILLIYYCFFLISVLRGLNKLKTSAVKEPLNEFISIIIPFRNEEENILKNLKSLEEQYYPEEKFEVIYVNDASTDNSLKILKSSVKKKNVKIFTLPENSLTNGGKKRAVSYGIEKSNGDIIVATDADCYYSPVWLINLLSSFDDAVGFVSGPVDFINGKDLFSGLQRLEFAGLILTGAGLIGINQPVICNAANIAYRKKIFQEIKGFHDHLHISSGDDGFLMQKIHISKKYSIRFCLNRNAVVKTKPMDSIVKFYRQRKRWASKNLFYSNKKLILKLILIFLYYTGIIFQFILVISLSKLFLISLLLSLSLKFILEFQIIKKGKKLLFPGLETRYFLLAEVLQIPYIIIAGITGLFRNFMWKGREVKR